MRLQLLSMFCVSFARWYLWPTLIDLCMDKNYHKHFWLIAKIWNAFRKNQVRCSVWTPYWSSGVSISPSISGNIDSRVKQKVSSEFFEHCWGLWSSSIHIRKVLWLSLIHHSRNDLSPSSFDINFQKCNLLFLLCIFISDMYMTVNALWTVMSNTTERRSQSKAHCSNRRRSRHAPYSKANCE